MNLLAIQRISILKDFRFRNYFRLIFKLTFLKHLLNQ